MIRTRGFGHLGRRVDTDITLRDHKTGKFVRGIHARSETEEEKKNKKRNPKYARLCSFDPWRIFTLSQNVVTGELSIAIKPCKYPLYETLDIQKLMKLYGAIAICGLPLPSSEVLNYGYLAKKSYVDPERLRRGIEFRAEEFRDTIKAQKKVYKAHLKAHRRRRKNRK
jgi:hypothetical protein